MGNCCTGRTDINGAEKGDKNKKKSSGPSGSTATPGESVKFKSMDSVRNTIINVLKSGKLTPSYFYLFCALKTHADTKKEILVLTIAMSKFNDFMNDLQALLILINKETKSIMIPICLSHSPINPNKDFIVVFRTHENVQSLSLDGWFTTNIV